jgi:hypothetical protein
VCDGLMNTEPGAVATGSSREHKFVELKQDPVATASGSVFVWQRWHHKPNRVSTKASVWVEEYRTGSSSDRVNLRRLEREAKQDPVATASGSVFV